VGWRRCNKVVEAMTVKQCGKVVREAVRLCGEMMR
jgi:hypothetical protein